MWTYQSRLLSRISGTSAFSIKSKIHYITVFAREVFVTLGSSKTGSFEISTKLGNVKNLIMLQFSEIIMLNLRCWTQACQEAFKTNNMP